MTAEARVFRALALSESFGLHIIVCSARTEADLFLRRLQSAVSALREGAVVVDRVDPYRDWQADATGVGRVLAEADLVDQITAVLHTDRVQLADRRTVVVLDGSLARLVDGGAWGAVFRHLNEQRNRAIRAIATDFILLLPPWLELLLAREAPDFWSVRSTSLVVPSTPRAIDREWGVRLLTTLEQETLLPRLHASRNSAILAWDTALRFLADRPFEATAVDRVVATIRRRVAIPNGIVPSVHLALALRVLAKLESQERDSLALWEYRRRGVEDFGETFTSLANAYHLGIFRCAARIGDVDEAAFPLWHVEASLPEGAGPSARILREAVADGYRTLGDTMRAKAHEAMLASEPLTDRAGPTR